VLTSYFSRGQYVPQILSPNPSPQYRQRGPFGFLRKPVVQLGILAIAALVVFIIAVTGGK